MSSRRTQGSVYLGLAGVLLLASAGLLGAHYATGDEGVSTAEAHRGQETVQPSAVRAAAQAYVDGTVVLASEGVEHEMPWSDLGLAVAGDEAVAAAAARISAGADVAAELERLGAMPVSVDRAAATETLRALKARTDVTPTDARLDLENREVVKHQPGFGLDIYASLGAVERAARAGADRVELLGVALPARVTVDDLGIDDISTVLGRFTTNFRVNDNSRNFNLKLAASKLNGYVMKPGEEFSFNDVVGPRTEKEGYKIAHVITAGEMVDGLAGGTCQISTTLHGAAFFAGLGIPRAQPHSRPSTYVAPGLDATVVYPYVDLELKNPYDFPVVIHYKVMRGQSLVEILGKERPYDKIAFTRKVLEEFEFDTVTREDDEMPVGSMIIDQFGYPGYKVMRYRKYYKDGKLVKTDKWKIQYRPVTEYVRTGANPDPNLEPPEQEAKKAKYPSPKKPGYIEQ